MSARGTFVTAVLPGSYGKPRPALVVQDDRYSRLQSVIVIPLTTNVQPVLEALRPSVLPDRTNGLPFHSQVMVDKISAIPVGKVGGVIGTADEALMQRVNAALSQMLEL
jgi:mRNA interferase MazF